MIITDINLLKIPCKLANVFSANNIIKKLEEELKLSNVPGCGLAANQIGILEQVCIIRGMESINLINPRIVSSDDPFVNNNEGCLSFPNTYIATKRYKQILVVDHTYPSGIMLFDESAIIAEHEIKHLMGLTMFDDQVAKLKPNEKCWCGSGKKYKKCHISNDFDFKV